MKLLVTLFLLFVNSALFFAKQKITVDHIKNDQQKIEIDQIKKVVYTNQSKINDSFI